MDNKSSLEVVRTPSRFHLKAVVVTAVIGIVAAAIIILAFTFRVEFGILLLVSAGAAGAHQWLALKRQHATNKREGRVQEAQTKLIEAQANHAIAEVDLLGVDHRRRSAEARAAEAEARTAEVGIRKAIIDARIHQVKGGTFFFKSDWKFTFIPSTAGERKELAAQVEQSEPLPRFLDVVGPEECVCIYGSRGTAKTTNMLHWAAGRPGELIVLDPKGSRNPWPAQNVIKDEARFVATVQDVKERLRLRRINEEFDKPPITLIVDELYNITRIMKLDIMEDVFGIIALGREYHVHAAFTASGKGVKDLGIEGQSGLLENLTLVHCLKIGNPPAATFKVGVDMGEGFFQVEPPGRYHVHPAPVVPMALSDEEKVRAELLLDPDRADGTIQAAVWGSRGGRNNAERKALIKAIRAMLDNK